MTAVMQGLQGSWFWACKKILGTDLCLAKRFFPSNAAEIAFTSKLVPQLQIKE